MKKIAVVGCGAVGLNYGTRLLESELFAEGAKVVQQPIDVSLVVRRDYELLISHGVRVKYGLSGCSSEDTGDHLLLSAEDLRGKVYPTTQALSSSKGRMSWIIVCCKSYSICSQFMESLECIADDSTKFLIIMNGLDVESSFVEWFGAGRVFGGLSKIACNRGPNPPLEPGPLILQCFADISLEIGHVLDDELLLCEASQLFANTAISSIVQVTSNLLRSRWAKLCWNITFTGISVAMGGLTCDVIVGDASLRTLAARVIADVVRVANADLRRQHQQRTHPCPDLNLMPEEETIGKLDYSYYCIRLHGRG